MGPARLSGSFFVVEAGGGTVPLSRHRFPAMSGEHLSPDIVFPPCRNNTSPPTSFFRHVGAA